jgi:4-hydroxyproline epimerase
MNPLRVTLVLPIASPRSSPSLSPYPNSLATATTLIADNHGQFAIPRAFEVVDSHTAGEPTRCVLSGGPDLGSGPLTERLECACAATTTTIAAPFCASRAAPMFWSAHFCWSPSIRPTPLVIFFNNAGYLGMCGHGAIGVAVTLAISGRIQPGTHVLETPVGPSCSCCTPGNRVSIRNVPAYRFRKNSSVDIPGYGPVTGDVAWGGNWFFLVGIIPFPKLTFSTRWKPLTAFAWEIRQL